MNKNRNVYKKGQKVPKRQQPKKDNKSKRINFDNERIEKFDRDVERTAGSNALRWYANNTTLLNAAASIPFSTVVGSAIPNTDWSIPGVMQLQWVPSIGGDPNVINQAANSTYSNTVHANSRNQSYDATDEMLLILAGANVFSAIALGLRAFGTMRRYNQIDRYTPAALLYAMGFNPEDLKLNYSKMWFDLNELIARSQQIWIPNTMPVIERWFWLNSNIYYDSNNPKAQYYVFTPKHFLKYDETTFSNGGALVPQPWLVNNNYGSLSNASEVVTNTWQQYLDTVNEMINALINSQDRGIIFGDILKAYGADKLYAVSPVSADYVVEPVYDPEVLSQIENVTVFPVGSGVPNVTNITHQEQKANPGTIMHSETGTRLVQIWNTYAASKLSANPVGYMWSLESLPPTLGSPMVLNMHTMGAPTPEQIMIATRLMAIGLRTYEVQAANGLQSYGWVGPGYSGTEVISRVVIVNLSYSDGAIPVISGQQLPNNRVHTQEWSNEFIVKWMSFDWAPFLRTTTAGVTLEGLGFTDNPATNANKFFKIASKAAVGDYQNYTYVVEEELLKMHTTAIYSEFGVPTIF